jgi:hypothetical protein
MRKIGQVSQIMFLENFRFRENVCEIFVRFLPKLKLSRKFSRKLKIERYFDSDAPRMLHALFSSIFVRKFSRKRKCQDKNITANIGDILHLENQKENVLRISVGFQQNF